ncbi:hypothetical protein BI364_14930 [Acidihalobacter yilgarnensis]|uniref:Uncharacterized protein n=1 Tax=Acidihalobacter yilgarnensis TaxID=2819280 RepID=A0A1D8IRF0_9GAMM|nr:hypothetical protein [Acidihalobacter yilgarnensis]AOU99062.1 hypothetical protein BI364_14930 [Acidihalobacter yilgarnensis]
MRQNKLKRLGVGIVVSAALAAPVASWAHAVAGMRVFPATMSFDDPGVANEFSTNYSQTKADGVTTKNLGLAYSKTITKRFGLSVASDYNWISQPGTPNQSGWDNITVGAAYQLFVNGPHEAIGMLALSDTLANSGSGGMDSNYSTVSPEFAFGKGMGDLPWSMRYLRPLAVSGAISMDMPSDATQPRMLNVGVSLQYSIPYLQSFVKYAGLKAPFNNMVPIVEYTMSRCAGNYSVCQNSGNLDATGSVNPGVIWVGKYYQLGIEAQIPATRASGNHVGILVGIDVYLDDVLPHSLGAPIFG